MTHPFPTVLRDRARRASRSIVFPEAVDPRILRACVRLAGDGLARPILVGAPEAIEFAASDQNLDLEGVEILDSQSAMRIDHLAEQLARSSGGRLSTEDAWQRVQDPLTMAAVMVGAGEADGVVAGAVRATPEVIRAGLLAIGTAPQIRVVSSAFYMCVGDFRGDGDEVLTFTDAGVIPDPSVKQLVEIARAAVEARRRIVGDEPRVAFLSFSTLGSAEAPSVDKVRQAARIFREAEPGIVSGGELQVDAALIPAVADRKAWGNPVAGRANVLVFPDLNSGNIGYKLVERLAGAVALGPILQGLRAPLNDLSRGASTEDVELVACITALMAAGTQKGPAIARYR